MIVSHIQVQSHDSIHLSFSSSDSRLVALIASMYSAKSMVPLLSSSNTLNRASDRKSDLLPRASLDSSTNFFFCHRPIWTDLHKLFILATYLSLVQSWFLLNCFEKTYACLDSGVSPLKREVFIRAFLEPFPRICPFRKRGILPDILVHPGVEYDQLYEELALD